MLRPLRHVRATATALVALALSSPITRAEAAELQPRTLAAFNHYVTLTEQRITSELNGPAFLHVDQLEPEERREALAALARGELFIERLDTRENGREIDIPDGLVHHWVGMVFVPGVTVNDAVALLQDYDAAATIYSPRIDRSTLRAQQDHRFEVYLRFVLTKVITVVLDTEHVAEFFHPDPDRAYSRIRSTSIAEVEEAGTPRERLKPTGRDGGYLWRLNTYWRFLARDGGVYIQCESVSLTRGIPTGFGWLIRPFITSIPRESLAFTMETTRTALAQPAP